MDLLKKLGQFFIYSNVFVSFCVLALCQSTSIIIGVDSSHLLPFVFFSTLFAYNFQRMIRFSSNKEQSANLDWLNKNRLVIIVITVISLFLSVYYALSLSFSTFYFFNTCINHQLVLSNQNNSSRKSKGFLERTAKSQNISYRFSLVYS